MNASRHLMESRLAMTSRSRCMASPRARSALHCLYVDGCYDVLGAFTPIAAPTRGELEMLCTAIAESSVAAECVASAIRNAPR